MGFGFIAFLRIKFGAIPKNSIKINFAQYKKVLKYSAFGIFIILLIQTIISALNQNLGIQEPTQFEFVNNIGKGVFLILFVGAIIGPICEEYFFRGYMLTVLAAKSPAVGIIVTSIIFAAFHGSFILFLPLFIMGLILAISYYYSKNLLIPITIHVLNNLFAFLTLFYIGK
jgi:membrane protease YdiL (CAAX protease family)